MNVYWKTLNRKKDKCNDRRTFWLTRTCISLFDKKISKIISEDGYHMYMSIFFCKNHLLLTLTYEINKFKILAAPKVSVTKLTEKSFRVYV